MYKTDKDKALQWLNSKWQSKKNCPICDSNNWSVSNNLVELREYSGGNLRIGAPVYPLYSITCLECGHTLLFNALIAKLVSAETKTGNSAIDEKGNENV
jgi:predicted nucleic-acid-binding Zn-ribbon protein